MRHGEGGGETSAEPGSHTNRAIRAQRPHLALRPGAANPVLGGVQLIARRTRTLACVTLDLAHPLSQRLRRAAETSRQSSRSSPIATDDRLDGLAPSARLARALPVNISLSSSSWLHLLKVRSLRQTRRGSFSRLHLLDGKAQVLRIPLRDESLTGSFHRNRRAGRKSRSKSAGDRLRRGASSSPLLKASAASGSWA